MTIRDYFGKIRGTTHGSPPRVSHREVLWPWTGAFLDIAAIAWVNRWWFEGTDLGLLIGSLGASAVLVFGAIRSPLAQPRNLIGGQRWWG